MLAAGWAPAPSGCGEGPAQAPLLLSHGGGGGVNVCREGASVPTTAAKNSALSTVEGTPPGLHWSPLCRPSPHPLPVLRLGPAQGGASRPGPHAGSPSVSENLPRWAQNTALELPLWLRTRGPGLGVSVGLRHQRGLGALPTRELRASLCPAPSFWLLTPAARGTPRSGWSLILF